MNAISVAILIALVSLVASAPAVAQELPPQVFLYKISMRLVGHPPTLEEKNLLRSKLRSSCDTVSCLESFFRSFIREKMNQSEFYAIAYEKVTERMGYKAPPSTALSQIIQAGKATDSASEGRDFMLIYRTFKENAPIDDLFTSQIVTDPIYPDISAANTSFERFSIDVSKMSRPPSQSTYDLRLENGSTITAAEFNLNGHPNVSGLFSSTRFLLRYWNSPINLNRKRSAAFFRLMLCDSMSPALERETQKEKELRLALGISDEQTSLDELAKIHLNKHANQKDCAVCHDRLDPLGRTMRPLEIGVSGVPFKGRLRFANSLSENADIPVDNFHDLTVKTTQQSKYIDCQTNWMIETFLGKDLGLPPLRFAEVLKVVENNKRRVKSTIEELLMLPEFRGLVPKIIEPASLVAAKAVLSNCSECHSNLFKERPEQIRARLSRISVCLDLPNDGKSRAMPPSDHYWDPSQEEVMAVKTWISRGGPLSDDVNLFDRAEVQKVLSPPAGVRKCRQ
jgi:hypothetical protein